MLLSCSNHSPYTLLEGFAEGFVEGVSNTLKEEKKTRKDPKYTQTSKATPAPSSNTNLKSKKSKKTEEGFSNYTNNKSEIPLMFANTKFSPKCCPTTYTNTMGCACMSMSQYRYLIERGGNNVPFSEY